LGNERVTVQGLQIVKADPESDLIMVKGSVPGPNGGIVVIKQSTKRRSQSAAA